MGAISKPLVTSLNDISVSHHLIATLLPSWEKLQREDNLAILNTIEMLHSNVSLALACIQAQTWTNIAVKDIIQDGIGGILPLEIRSIMWKYATQSEKRLYSWWKMVNFTCNPQLNQATTYIIIILMPKLNGYLLL